MKRESFPRSQSSWCWMCVDVKDKTLKRQDGQSAPIVTHKICLPLPVSERGTRKGVVQTMNQPSVVFSFPRFFFPSCPH